MHRRRFLELSAAAAALPLLPAPLGAATPPGPVLLRAAEAQAPLMGAGAPETPVWAYAGRVPGPTLRFPRARPVHVRLENALPDATTVHWHGVRIANAMDGVSGLTQAPVAPGAGFDYRFTAPDAGTYWYHSHHRSWEQVARGLYGLLIVDEDTPYPVDADLPFVADDWRLTERGRIAGDMGHIRDATHGGRLGNWLTVNGRTGPALAVRPGARLRLRCVSAANARIMRFRFPGLAAATVAVDGQPLAAPERLDPAQPLTLAPAQRADVVVDIPVDAEGALPIEEVSTAEPIVAATFQVAGEPLRTAPPGAVPALPDNPLRPLDLSDPLVVELVMEGGAMGGLAQGIYRGRMFDMRTLVMEHGQAWTFNGVAGRTETPLAAVPLGRPVVLDVVNDTRWPHAMHLHGHHFRAVERDGRRVAAAPWRDTELIAAGARVRLAFVADNPGRWLFHCHMLEHHMAGMGTWLQVG